MESGVEDDPAHQESGQRGHEAFFGHFPSASVFLFIHALENGPVEIKRAGIDHGEANQAQGPRHARQAENQAQEHAQDLSSPIDDVQEVVLVIPQTVGRESAVQQRPHGTGRRRQSGGGGTTR